MSYQKKGKHRYGVNYKIKVITQFRLLRSGVAYDNIDHGKRMGEQITEKHSRNFVRNFKMPFGSIYLRKPAANELKRVEESYGDTGFIGCGGSMDYVKLIW